MLPVLDDELTEDGQEIVDLATVLLMMDEDPRKGSLRPHWYNSPRAPISPGVADVAPRLRSIITPALLLYS